MSVDERPPLPAAEEIEQSLLGCIVLYPQTLDDAAAYIGPEDFYHAFHARIFEAMLELRGKDVPIDLVTLNEHFHGRNELARVGGASYIADLTNSIPVAASIGSYLAIVKEKARQRTAIAAAQCVIASLASGGCNADEAIAEFNRRIESSGTSDVGYRVLKEFESEVFDKIHRLRDDKRELPGLTYGIAAIDDLTGGMHPGEITVVGARTGVGKSSFALGASLAIAKLGFGVYYRSDEMRGYTIFGRTLSALSFVNGFKIRNPKGLSDSDFEWIAQAAHEIRPLKIGIDDKPGLHIDQVLARASQRVRREGKLLCVFDFVQRARSSGRTQFDQVSYTTRAIADFARSSNVHCMVLSQIKRLGKDSDGEPGLEDLKMTGELEENADCAILLHRVSTEENPGPDFAIVAKQRNGAADLKVEIEFNRNTLLYQNYRKPVYKP